jgi:hypothetical protein
MLARLELLALRPSAAPAEGIGQAMDWIATHCRQVAEAHMALAEKAEDLMEQFLIARRFRAGLRSFARHHRRAAWQHLEMARRAEAALHGGCEDFDLTDTVSTTP